MLSRTSPTAALAVMPNFGQTVNVEDQGEFNAIAGNFLARVDSGRWPSRDPRAVTASMTGMC